MKTFFLFLEFYHQNRRICIFSSHYLLSIYFHFLYDTPIFPNSLPFPLVFSHPFLSLFLSSFPFLTNFPFFLFSLPLLFSLPFLFSLPLLFSFSIFLFSFFLFHSFSLFLSLSQSVYKIAASDNYLAIAGPRISITILSLPDLVPIFEFDNSNYKGIRCRNILQLDERQIDYSLYPFLCLSVCLFFSPSLSPSLSLSLSLFLSLFLFLSPSHSLSLSLSFSLSHTLLIIPLFHTQTQTLKVFQILICGQGK